jgi:hypothetical protein
MANRRIDWDRQALRQFNKAILHIAEESVQNAEIVRLDIIEKIEALIPNPLAANDKSHSTKIILAL